MSPIRFSKGMKRSNSLSPLKPEHSDALSPKKPRRKPSRRRSRRSKSPRRRSKSPRRRSKSPYKVPGDMSRSKISKGWIPQSEERFSTSRPISAQVPRKKTITSRRPASSKPLRTSSATFRRKQGEFVLNLDFWLLDVSIYHPHVIADKGYQSKLVGLWAFDPTQGTKHQNARAYTHFIRAFVAVAIDD